MRGYRRIVAWGLLAVGLVGGGVGRADGALLDPNSPTFTSRSQGDVVLASGTYFFTLGTSGPTLQMYNGVSFSTVATGFIYNGINVFDFHSLQVQAGASIGVTQSSASGPIAILASTSINMAGSIDVSANAGNAFGGPGASNLFVGGQGNTGTAPGTIGAGSLITTGGGGGSFGGTGLTASSAPIIDPQTGLQVGTVGGGSGGSTTFVSLLDQLRGGSAGGNGGNSTSTVPGSSGAPGQGGGAIEMGAVGSISVSGMISANGSAPIAVTNPTSAGGGGGSGGGILIHGNTVNLSGTLSAVGGQGGNGLTRSYSTTGGAGGGGLIQIVQSGTPGGYVNTGNILVSNGRFDVLSVPEPSSVVMLGIAAISGIAVIRCRRHRD